MTELRSYLQDLLENIGGSAGDLIDKVQALDPVLRLAVAGVATLLETNVATGLLVPGDTVALVASASVQSLGEGVVLALVLAFGSFVGEISGYWLGRWVGPTWHRRRWLRRRARQQRIGYIGQMVQKRGGPWILTSRFIPVLRTVTPFVVGVHSFPFRQFLAWTAASCALWATIYVTVYGLASSSIRDDGGSPVLGAGLALVGALLFGGATLAQFAIERRHKRADRTEVGHL